MSDQSANVNAIEQYPDYGPECDVDGCDHHVPGLKYGYDSSLRDGVVCADCWEYWDKNREWPDGVTA